MTLDPQTEAPPPKLGIACPTNCTFHPSKIGWKNANALAATRARGAGEIVFLRRYEELTGLRAANTTAHRHFKHYVKPADPKSDEEVVEGPKPSDIQILDSIIGAGFRNSKNWKPTIRDTLEAMKLKTQMTGNSAFDELIALFDVNDDGEDEDSAPESADALLSPDERPDEGAEELESPLGGE